MFQRLTDHPADGVPEDALGIDRMLSNVTLYWLTGTGGSAAQVYYEDITANAWSSEPNEPNEWDDVRTRHRPHRGAGQGHCVVGV